MSLVFVVVGSVLLMFLFLHWHLAKQDSNKIHQRGNSVKISRGTDIKPSTESLSFELQHLLSNTRGILADIMSANPNKNISVSHDIVHEILRMGSLVHNEIMEEWKNMDNSTASSTHSDGESDHIESHIQDLKIQLEKLELEKRQLKKNQMKAKHIFNGSSLIEENKSRRHKHADKWLVVGIPTVARKNNLDYLMRTLESIDIQLPKDPSHPLYGKILIHIVNLQHNVDGSSNSNHKVYHEAYKRYKKVINFLVEFTL